MTSIITTYLYNLAQKFSKYYENVPILTETDKNTKISRLALLNAIQIVLANGMKVLGMKLIDKI